MPVTYISKKINFSMIKPHKSETKERKKITSYIPCHLSSSKSLNEKEEELLS